MQVYLFIYCLSPLVDFISNQFSFVAVPTQKTALQALYSATNGANWKYPGWTPSTDLCNGFDFEDNNHVRCDDLGNVVSM